MGFRSALKMLTSAFGRTTLAGTKGFLHWHAALLVGLVTLGSCDDVERSQSVGLGGGAPGRRGAAVGAVKAETKPTQTLTFSDEDFVESDANRDPFRSYTTLFKIEGTAIPQRKVIMSTTSVEEMRLIAIISGVPTPRAMLVDPIGVGYVVERGMFIGRPQVVRASENVVMTLNWKVDRIRPNEVVLTREDPADPNRPPLTRVIPLREEEATRENK